MGPSKRSVITLNGEYLLTEQQNETLRYVPEEALVQELLYRLGEDAQREGLIDTPKRWVKWMKEFLHDERVTDFKMTVFDSEGMDEMIVVANIPLYSFCEHHIAPIVGYASVAYIPDQKIVGLSKIPRAVDFFSHRLQNQERITLQIAEFLQKNLKPKGVAVSITARHFCMEMRGVKKHDTWTTTTKLIGIFKEDPEAKNEFLTKIKNK